MASRKLWDSTTWKGCLACLWLLIGSAPAHAQLTPPTAPTAAPIRKLWTAASNAHQPAPVPPGLEIEILDPNVDPRGNPAVLTCPKVVCTRQGPEQRLFVDLPETVIVHRYYYTGDRTFQGPFLAGGPSIVVLNHPKTGERLYIPVQMLPGAPRVTYRHCSVEYDYGTQGITIEFGLLGRPSVSYRHGVPLATKIKKVTTCMKDESRHLLDRTDIPECKDKMVNGAKNVALTSVDRVNDLAKRVIEPVVAVVQMLPGAQMLSSTVEQRAERERDATVKRAQAEAARAEAFIPTNH